MLVLRHASELRERGGLGWKRLTQHYIWRGAETPDPSSQTAK